jgi:hypothetical protein
MAGETEWLKFSQAFKTYIEWLKTPVGDKPIEHEARFEAYLKVSGFDPETPVFKRLVQHMSRMKDVDPEPDRGGS